MTAAGGPADPSPGATPEGTLLGRDLSAQAGRRRRMAALADLGVAIHLERTEAAILARVRDGLRALGLAPLLLRPEGDRVRLLWVALPPDAEAALDGPGRPAGGMVGPWTEHGRRIWREGAAFSDDWAAQAAAFLGATPHLHGLAARLGLVRSIGLRLDERGGATRYLVAAGEWIGPDDLPALRLLGAQVSAALDSARAFAELEARNAELTLLADLAAATATLDPVVLLSSALGRVAATL